MIILHTEYMTTERYTINDIMSESLDPSSVEGLIAGINDIDEKRTAIHSNIELSKKEKKARHENLLDERGQKLFSLLMERQNPNYDIYVTFFRQELDEINTESSNKFIVNVSGASGKKIGEIGASLKTLSRLPQFQGDSEKVLSDFLRPDIIITEEPEKFIKRAHTEVRNIGKKFKQARRENAIDEMMKINIDKNSLFWNILETRVNNPEIRNKIDVLLEKGERELLIKLIFKYANEDEGLNYGYIPWTKDRDDLVMQANGYAFIDPQIIDSEVD